MRVSEKTRIKADRETVWAWVRDPARYPQFMDGVDRIDQLSPTQTHWVTSIGGVTAWTTQQGIRRVQGGEKARREGKGRQEIQGRSAGEERQKVIGRGLANCRPSGAYR